MNTTTNYRKFKFLIDNRDTARQHINRLKEAIQHNPKILEVQPILVNENMEIIDGQHRFQAASELGLPITYSQVEGLGIHTAREMNTLQRRWSMIDYARSYAKNGNLHYKAFLKYHNENPGLAPSVLLIAMGSKNTGKHGASMNFRNGEFVVGRDMDEVDEILERFQEVRNTISVPFSGALARALIVCFDNEEFVWDRFIGNLKAKPELIQRSTVTRDFLRMLEEVYNYRYSSNAVRLF